MKVVLIDPKGVWEGLNNGIAYIAASLRGEHDVHVIDFVNNTKGSMGERLLSAKNADFVGISIKSFTLLESIMVGSETCKTSSSWILSGEVDV